MIDQDGIATEPPRTSRAWIVTFTDLVSLMLTFFVMLFSMSNVKVDKWETLTDTLSRSLSPVDRSAPITATAKLNIATVLRKPAINLDYLFSVLQETVAGDQLLSQSQILRLDDRLIIAFPSDLLFERGRAQLSPRAQDAIFNLGGVLRNVGNRIGVNGHTDPMPIDGGAYASNWELSLARAAAVADALKRSGYTEDLTAYGFADSRFIQLPDLPVKERYALGRRVDVVIMPNREGV
jgi:chemotaxis protein MotB